MSPSYGMSSEISIANDNAPALCIDGKVIPGVPTLFLAPPQ